MRQVDAFGGQKGQKEVRFRSGKQGVGSGRCVLAAVQQYSSAMSRGSNTRTPSMSGERGTLRRIVEGMLARLAKASVLRK